MKILKYNREGYHDPTAYSALVKIERERLRKQRMTVRPKEKKKELPSQEKKRMRASEKRRWKGCEN